MREIEPRRVHPALKELVTEASQALARLDADRLEELVLSCQALNRDTAWEDAGNRAALAAQARESQAEMAVFARVLDATRANLKVMGRLRELHQKLEYSDPHTEQWGTPESGYGNN